MNKFIIALTFFFLCRSGLSQSGCQPCRSGTSGPCQNVNGGDLVCYAYQFQSSEANSCPSGTKDCSVYQSQLPTTSSVACSNCWTGTSGYCKDSNSVCYPHYAGSTTCPSGTNQCVAEAPISPVCQNCFSGSSGPCQNSNNHVCYAFNLGTQQCPSGTTVCCDSSCSSCSGPSSSQCLSCPANKYLKNGVCTQCPSHYYQNSNNFSGTSCFECDRSCATCSGGSATQCTSCVQNFYLDNGSCLACDENCLTCSGSSTTCTSCRSHFVQVASTCVECHSSCATCSGASSSQCLTCPVGSVQSGTTCNSCPSSCSACSASGCQSCPMMKYASGNSCTNCPNGYYQAVDFFTGTSCTVIDGNDLPTPIYPTYINNCNFPIDFYRLFPNSAPQLYGSLQPGQSQYYGGLFIGSVFTFKNSNTGKVVKIYKLQFVTPNPSTFNLNIC